MVESRRTGTGRLVTMLATARRAVVVGSALALVAGFLTVSAPSAVAAAPHSQLHGVTCVKSTNCIAVGEYQPTADSGRTLIERWNGKAWSIVTSPNPAGIDFARLFAVTCVSASNCFAVGEQFTRSGAVIKSLVERWNGKAWSIVGSANPKLGGELLSVACTSATVCTAVGLQLITPTQCCNLLVERWNGKTWTIVGAPIPAKSSYSRLDGVTCTSASKCFAVGYYAINGTSFTLVERWNGTAWTIVPSPNPEIGEGGYLKSVSCTSATNCVAAGAYLEGGSGRPATLIEQWNGKAWTIVANALPPRAYTELNGVACANATSCFTVGDWNRSTGSHTLIQRWNGKKWSLATSPTTTGANHSLAAVGCASPSDCFAVGSVSTGSGGSVLVQHWNGTAWSNVAAPSR